MYRFHVTVTYYYDVDETTLQKDYDTTDPWEGAEIDQNNLVDLPHFLSEQYQEAEDSKITIRVERLCEEN